VSSAGDAETTLSRASGERTLSWVGKALDPDQLTPDERIHEVASLLAAGFVRHWLHRAVDAGEKDLAILRTSSEVCDEPQSEGESL
jgi:hypothetical protein